MSGWIEGCVMAAEMDEIVREGLSPRWKAHVRGLLNGRQPALVEELMAEGPNPKNQFVRGNITVFYYDYPVWLYAFDRHQIRDRGGGDVNIRSYQYQRDWYLWLVREQFDTIARRPTGKAVLKEVNAAGHGLYIVPWPAWKKHFDSHGTPFDHDAALHATARGTPLYRNGRETREIGLGGGADMVLQYTPNNWGAYREHYLSGQNLGPPTGLARSSGPGSDPDEVLYHELVHATRYLRGVLSLKPMAGYKNEEEYLAVVVTNIYLSDKGLTALRGRYEADVALHLSTLDPGMARNYENNPEHSTLPPMTLMRNFRQAQRDFFRDLAALSPRPEFNPARRYREITGEN
jgi:Effector protein